jgi:hypothetical protein
LKDCDTASHWEDPARTQKNQERTMRCRGGAGHVSAHSSHGLRFDLGSDGTAQFSDHAQPALVAGVSRRKHGTIISHLWVFNLAEGRTKNATKTPDNFLSRRRTQQNNDN